MLSYLKIENFRSLSKVDIELAQINVFIGPNGSGKTNLLEAIGLISAAVDGRIDRAGQMLRQIRHTHPNQFISAFKSTKSTRIRFETGSESLLTSYRCSVKPSTVHSYARRGLWQFFKEEIVAQGKVVAKRTTTDEGEVAGLGSVKLERESSIWTVASSSPKAPDSLNAFRNQLRGYNIFSPDTSALRGFTSFSETEERYPIGSNGAGLAHAVKRLLAKAENNPKLNDLMTEFLEPSDFYDGLKITPFPSARKPDEETLLMMFRDKYATARNFVNSVLDVSEGILHLLFMMVLSLSGDAPQILAIENFDHLMNPRLARNSMANVVKGLFDINPDRQVFMTTHNPLTLDALPLGDPRVRLFTLDRGAKGATIVNPVVFDDALKLALDNDATLSDLWQGGFIGGMPNF